MPVCLALGNSECKTNSGEIKGLPSMKKSMDASVFHDWLSNSRGVEYAGVLAARIALRVLPVVELALRNDGGIRRSSIVLPSFRTLVLTGCACTMSGRSAQIRDLVRRVGQNLQDSIDELVQQTRLNAIDVREGMPEFNGEIWRLENDVHSLEVARRAIDVVVQAALAIDGVFDFNEKIGGKAAVHQIVLSAADVAQYAIDGIHEDTILADALAGDKPDPTMPPHIVEFWNSIALDVDWLESDQNKKRPPLECASALYEQNLWPGEIPTWASGKWAEFKGNLPDSENWQVWISWYEARLRGQPFDLDVERELAVIADEEWEKSPFHVNSLIQSLIQSHSDPQSNTFRRSMKGLEDDSRDANLDLSQFLDRIRIAHPEDPSQVIGATKEMLESVMKTMLHRRENTNVDKLNFPDLSDRCMKELGLLGNAEPATEVERHRRRIASSAQKMMLAANNLRNVAGTGHGRAADQELDISRADASLVASVGSALASWLLGHHMVKRTESSGTETANRKGN